MAYKILTGEKKVEHRKKAGTMATDIVVLATAAEDLENQLNALKGVISVQYRPTFFIRDNAVEERQSALVELKEK